jgi:hypothetical protein
VQVALFMRSDPCARNRVIWTLNPEPPIFTFARLNPVSALRNAEELGPKANWQSLDFGRSNQIEKTHPYRPKQAVFLRILLGHDFFIGKARLWLAERAKSRGNPETKFKNAASSVTLKFKVLMQGPESYASTLDLRFQYLDLVIDCGPGFRV